MRSFNGKRSARCRMWRKEREERLLFVGHNMGSMQQLCRKGVLLENGSVAFSGIMGEVINAYQRGYCYAAGVQVWMAIPTCFSCCNVRLI